MCKRTQSGTYCISWNPHVIGGGVEQQEVFLIHHKVYTNSMLSKIGFFFFFFLFFPMMITFILCYDDVFLNCLATKGGWPTNIIHFWTCRISCHFLIHFVTWLILIFVTLCEVRWDWHSIRNQWGNLESGGHSMSSLHWLSQLVCVVLNPETHTILPSLKSMRAKCSIEWY